MVSQDELVHDVTGVIRQSGPVDLSARYDPANMAGKTIVITGGASGFGAAFARSWAGHGANIVLGDIDDAAGEALAAELRAATGSEHHYYLHCDVADWQSQAAFFRAAARLEPGGIDVVVANAGVADIDSAITGRGVENPRDLDSDNPPPPRLNVIDVNLTGVIYTVHLALFWLERNGKGKDAAANGGKIEDDSTHRDRLILLIGSMAGVSPLPGQLQYTVAKHGVTGLFRSLRGTSWRQGVRVNMLCPYFVATPLMPRRALYFVAGGGLGRLSDVVDAASRFVADARIAGRALVVGPRVRVEQDESGDKENPRLGDGLKVVDIAPEGEDEEGEPAEGTVAVWECYAHDYDNVELFVWNYVRLLNTIVRIRGWIGWARDVIRVYFSRHQ